jgi:hypothetical protein
MEITPKAPIFQTWHRMAMRIAQNARRPVGANKLKLADIWGAAIGLPGRGKSLCHVFQGESRQTLQRLDGCRCEAE